MPLKTFDWYFDQILRDLIQPLYHPISLMTSKKKGNEGEKKT